MYGSTILFRMLKQHNLNYFLINFNLNQYKPIMKFFSEHLAIWETSMTQLETQQLPVYIKAEKGIELCREVLHKFRTKVLSSGFKNKEMECLFFKNVKPKVVGYIIHFINLVNIERHRPFEPEMENFEFLATQISQLRRYFIEHREFYEYYIRGQSHRDTEFFTRDTISTELYSTSIASIIDNSFSTSHDMILARIKGNMRTIKYLQKKIIPATHNSQSYQDENPFKLKWTGAKVDLVELIYALHSSTLINHGNVEIKELAKGIEKLFSIDIGDFYRIFLEIRMRKTNQTKLLDFLKTSIKNKIAEADA